MKPETAIRLWNEAISTSLGGDMDGNEYTQTTIFGAFVLAKEIGPVTFYEANYKPENLKKAEAFLREWADGILNAIKLP